MRITNSNFYIITITALAALLIIGLYFFSRKSNCCGECNMHDHAAEQANEHVVEIPVTEQSEAEVTQDLETLAENSLKESAATQNLK